MGPNEEIRHHSHNSDAEYGPGCCNEMKERRYGHTSNNSTIGCESEGRYNDGGNSEEGFSRGGYLQEGDYYYFLFDCCCLLSWKLEFIARRLLDIFNYLHFFFHNITLIISFIYLSRASIICLYPVKFTAWWGGYGNISISCM